jgi:hypothetical protein
MFSGPEGEGDSQDDMEEMMVSGRQEFWTIEAEF